MLSQLSLCYTVKIRAKFWVYIIYITVMKWSRVTPAAHDVRCPASGFGNWTTLPSLCSWNIAGCDNKSKPTNLTNKPSNKTKSAYIVHCTTLAPLPPMYAYQRWSFIKAEVAPTKGRQSGKAIWPKSITIQRGQIKTNITHLQVGSSE